MSRNQLLWGVLLALAALLLASMPLLGLLGYESSLVLAVLGSLSGAQLGVATVRSARTRASRADSDLAEAHPLGSVARLWRRAAFRAWLTLLLPLAILSANALRIKNCDLGGGLLWFVALPMASAALASAVGVTWGLAWSRRATLLAMMTLGASVAWGLWRFYFAPPVFAYDPFVGYLAGPIYDEEVAVGPALLHARILHFLGAASALAWAAALLDGRQWTLALPLRRREAVLALALSLLGGMAFQATRSELAPDAVTIAAHLGARQTTAHFELLYSPLGPWAKEIALTAEEAEFRYRQLAPLLGAVPDGKTTVYLFADANEKRRWTGAGHTQVAKPWRREIYLQHDAWPHPVLQHELAHVFAGAFGDSIFHVARHGLLINVGLIEGAAVASETVLAVDQQAKVLRLAQLLPSLQSIFGYGFLSRASAQAYSVAGSFCRFLLATRGAESFRALYRSGGDFSSVYGRTLEELETEWLVRIDATPLSEEERVVSFERLRRPGVFHKVCAHELALRRERARAFAAQGDATGALVQLESVCHDDPDDPAQLVALLDGALAAGKFPQAIAVAREIMAHPKSGASERAHAWAALGDLALRRREPSAADWYRQALTLPLDPANGRLLRAKLIAATDLLLSESLARYLVGSEPHQVPDLELAQAVVLAAPERGLGHYLVARQLFARDHWREARAELSRARSLGLPDRGFLEEALRLEGIAAYRAGDRSNARQLFVELASQSPALAAEARDWIARCD